MPSETYNHIWQSVLAEYIRQQDPNNPPPPHQIEAELLEQINNAFETANRWRERGNRLPYMKTLPPALIARLMAWLHPIHRISCAGASAAEDLDLLALYCDSGENKGIYLTSEDALWRVAVKYNGVLTYKEFSEVLKHLRTMVERRTRCMDPNLIAVNNGIFDYKTKTLLPFSHDKVFLCKSKVNYNHAARNIVIHNPEDGTDWDVESWMESLSDDPEIVHLLWEVLGAIIRPFVRWGKSAWLYSERGNNGKGTLCELMRNLCGPGSFTSIPIADFGKDFRLEPLIRSNAIIVDENDVGSFLDKAANLKAVITNDVIQINRKFKTPVAFQFYGFMVQCLNGFPRVKDKSGSFYRRQLFIPMTKCFTGRERKYIKDDYLHRPEVLEYVLYKVLNMDYYTLSEPAACRDVLAEYQEFNDPVRQYWSELHTRFTWDLLPFQFLYDLYKAWSNRNAPSGSPVGRNIFIRELREIVRTDPDWYDAGEQRPQNRICVPEPLIGEYDLKDWCNPAATVSNSPMKYIPVLQAKYRGLLRNGC